MPMAWQGSQRIDLRVSKVGSSQATDGRLLLSLPVSAAGHHTVTFVDDDGADAQ